MADEDKTKSSPEFGPDNTDAGRKSGDWKTRDADSIAQEAIIWERNYLIVILIISLLLPLVVGLLNNSCYNLFQCEHADLKKYGYAWFGGLLGGTIFSMKWLYHSVAKNIWNIDRRLWRIFTPHLSGALALIVAILINSGTFHILEPNVLNFHKCYGIGFLVGYFSDNAIGKLTEIANVFFANKK